LNSRLESVVIAIISNRKIVTLLHYNAEHLNPEKAGYQWE
jgi:hypothetical protein